MENLEQRVTKLEEEVAALQKAATDRKCKKTLRKLFAPLVNVRK